MSFLEALFAQVEALREPAPLATWADRLDALLAALFSADDAEHEEARQKLQRATVALRAQAETARHTEPVPLAVVRDWLDQALAAGVSAKGFLGGAVTIAAMLPMRAVPVRQLFVCGLDDESFPRRDVAPPFDLISGKPQPGDRSRRLDDRQLFLDLLLSARDRLHLCFVGRSAKDNAEAAPSVVLAELFEHVDRTCATSDGRRPRDLVTVRHPLQPWSERYRPGGDPRLFSYARQPAPAVAERTDDQPWTRPGEDVLPAVAAPDNKLELDELEAFWWNPCRRFLQHGLRVRVRKEDEQEQDDEPFGLDALARYRLQDDAVARALRGEPEPDDALAWTRASGVLPVGAQGDVAFGALQDDTEELLGEARRFAGGRTRRVDLLLDGRRLVGEIDGFTGDALVYLRVSRLKPKDRMRAWLRHLIVAVQRAQAADGDEPWPATTRVLATDGAYRYQEVPADDARRYLERLLALRDVGMRRPLPFFEWSSAAVGEALHKGKDDASALRDGRKKFAVTDKDRPYLYDGNDEAIALCMRGRDPFEGGEQGEFFQLASELWPAPFSYLREER